MIADPVTSDASSTWRYAHTNTGFVSTAQMLVSCALPSTIV